MQSRTLKCAILGDKGIGKTSLIRSFCDGRPCLDSPPPLTSPRIRNVLYNSKIYSLIIADTDECLERRRAAIAEADLAIICYSVVDIQSFANISQRWISELEWFPPTKPFFLVGLKSDLREETNHILQLVDEGEAMHLAVQLRAQENVEKMFEELPVAWERSLSQQPVASTFFSVITKPFNFAYNSVPSIRQGYHNVVSCWSNPGAFVETKRSIVGYVPWLKGWVPLEDIQQNAEQNNQTNQKPKEKPQGNIPTEK